MIAIVFAHGVRISARFHAVEIGAARRSRLKWRAGNYRQVCPDREGSSLNVSALDDLASHIEHRSVSACEPDREPQEGVEAFLAQAELFKGH
jgi:hypothetical protein